MAVKDAQNGEGWHNWQPVLSKREPAALAEIEKELEDEIFYYKFVQYEFFRQWSELKNYANKNGFFCCLFKFQIQNSDNTSELYN